MALGRRAAYLRRCVRAQNLLQLYEGRSSVRRRVFQTHIQPKLGCSYQTFNKMISEVNPERQLRQIEQELGNL